MEPPWICPKPWDVSAAAPERAGRPPERAGGPPERAGRPPENRKEDKTKLFTLTYW